MGGRKAIVAGHVCLDITPCFPASARGQADGWLKPGKLVQVEEAVIHTGGAVSNTGLALKIFGADVALVGKIGNDTFGRLVLDELGKHADTDAMIVSDGASTSYSVVISAPGHDRAFLHNPGANDSFAAEDVSDDVLRQGRLLHFGYPPLMRTMYENGGGELAALFMRAKRFGLATSLDMAAIDPASDAAKADWRAILTRVLPHVDLFAPSVEELCRMIDLKGYEAWMRKAGGGDPVDVLTLDDIRLLGEQVIRLGARMVLIKCGHLGMYYRSASRDAIKELPLDGIDPAEWTETELFEPGYVPDRVLSATGAGDTSVAAFLAALLQGCSLRECLRLATAAGAACVTQYDALSGLMPLDGLREKIRSGWKKRLLSDHPAW